MQHAIISAADHRYFGLLQGLVLSCRERPQGAHIPICVLDLGMEPEQLAWLKAQGVEHVQPGWDVDFPGRAQTPETFRAQTARPFLPQHFPGYDVYLWMDADTWVQDWGAVETYLAAARGGRMAVTPEVDRCYTVTFNTTHALERYASYESVYGTEIAKQCGLNPTINSGVFALRHDAPHWAMWAEELEEALQRTQSFYIEQFALNFTLYTRKPPTYFLPARYNWISWYSVPLLKQSTGLFVEPSAPFAPIGIMHLTGDVKATRVRVAASDGRQTHRTLEYPGKPAHDLAHASHPGDPAGEARVPV
jgi:hypothetical protein